MRSDFEKWLTRLGMALSLVAILLVLFGCTAALIPSGVPTCPNRTAWSDSAQRCLPRDAAKGEG